MASLKAKRWLAAQGIILRRVHVSLELRNFATGTGSKRYSMPFHIIRMRRLYGDSKETVGYSVSLRDARKQAVSIVDSHRASRDETEWTYYIRDIRTESIWDIR